VPAGAVKPRPYIRFSPAHFPAGVSGGTSIAEDVLATLWLVAKVALLLAGLLLPGAVIARALHLPRTVATSFAGSAVALYLTVLALQFSGVTISLVSLAAGLALISGVAAIGGARLSRRASTPGPSHSGDTPGSAFQPAVPFVPRMGKWTPLYVLVWAGILLRAWQNPLAGPDIEFRWSFLAEQMLRYGTLDFYPPRSAGDFLRYFWVESIPPGASALHAWAFACAGKASATFTLPALILQIWSLHELVWRTAEWFAGVRAARLAVLAAAACPLLTWSVLLGQETGLTALALAGIAFALLGWEQTRAREWPVLLGLFATLGASAREYGLIFPVLAAAGIVAGRGNLRAWIGFASLGVIGVVWALRTWALTGNPFYSLSVGGAFPINERFVAWIKNDAQALGDVLYSVAGWQDIARYLLLFAPPALIGWAWLGLSAVRGSRPALWGFGAVAAVVGVWISSVPFTNGGLFYSMRVLSPALALGSIAAGVALASSPWSRPAYARAAPALLAALVLATLIPTLALPQNHWQTPWREWPAFKRPSEAPVAPEETVAAIIKLWAAGPGASPVGIIVADSPGFQRRFAPTGLRVIPFWSPQADSLFDATLPPAEVARRWRESGITHLVITKWQVNLDFFNRNSRWNRPPFRAELVAETSRTWIYAIRAGE